MDPRQGRKRSSRRRTRPGSHSRLAYLERECGRSTVEAHTELCPWQTISPISARKQSHSSNRGTLLCYPASSLENRTTIQWAAPLERLSMLWCVILI